MRVLKKCAVILTAICAIISLVPIQFIDTAEAATSYQYGYLVSTPQACIKHVSGNTYKVWGSSDPESRAVEITKGGTSGIFSVKTFYNMEVKVTAGEWKNEKFKYTNKNYSGNWASKRSPQTDYLWFHSESGTAYAYEGETFNGLVGDMILSTDVYGSPRNQAYGVTIRPTSSQWADIESGTANGKTMVFAVASVFEYKSSKPLSDPWGGGGTDPHPRQGREEDVSRSEAARSESVGEYPREISGRVEAFSHCPQYHQLRCIRRA